MARKMAASLGGSPEEGTNAWCWWRRPFAERGIELREFEREEEIENLS